MAELLEFMAQNPWQTFFLLFFVMAAMGLVINLMNRLLRTIKVLFRGWPPSHIDADGDWEVSDND